MNTTIDQGDPDIDVRPLAMHANGTTAPGIAADFASVTTAPKKSTRRERVAVILPALLRVHAGELVALVDGKQLSCGSRALLAHVRRALHDPTVEASDVRACADAIDLSSVAALAASEVSARAPERMRSFPCTDTGNAERFAAMHRGVARFVAEWGTWIVFDGKRWAKDSAGVKTDALAKLTVRTIYGEAKRAADHDKRADLAKWAEDSEARKLRTAMVELARSEPGMAVSYVTLDVDAWLLNVSNGTIDLRTGKLRPHAAADLLTKLAPVHFDARATCDRFERFLSEIMRGDAECVEFLRRFLGYCLTGDVREHMLAFWYGETGGNGKSTLTELLFFLMGDYAQKAAPDLLFRSARSDRHPTEIADLFRARLVVCNETSHDREWDEATVKDVTGGDVLKARRMREDFWSFEPTHKVVVFGNGKPKIKNTNDGGMQRRLRLLPFEVTFRGNPDKGLKDTLRGEAAGVLAYLVAGCLAWQKDGLPEAASITEATAGYFAEQDVIGRFVTERCDLNPLARLSRKSLRLACEVWADEAGEGKPSPKDLARWLLEHGVTQCSVRDAAGPVQGWRGIRLRSAEAPNGDARTGDRVGDRTPDPTPPSTSLQLNRVGACSDQNPSVTTSKTHTVTEAPEAIPGDCSDQVTTADRGDDWQAPFSEWLENEGIR